MWWSGSVSRDLWRWPLGPFKKPEDELCGWGDVSYCVAYMLDWNNTLTWLPYVTMVSCVASTFVYRFPKVAWESVGQEPIAFNAGFVFVSDSVCAVSGGYWLWDTNFKVAQLQMTTGSDLWTCFEHGPTWGHSICVCSCMCVFPFFWGNSWKHPLLPFAGKVESYIWNVLVLAFFGWCSRKKNNPRFCKVPTSWEREQWEQSSHEPRTTAHRMVLRLIWPQLSELLVLKRDVSRIHPVPNPMSLALRTPTVKTYSKTMHSPLVTSSWIHSAVIVKYWRVLVWLRSRQAPKTFQTHYISKHPTDPQQPVSPPRWISGNASPILAGQGMLSGKAQAMGRWDPAWFCNSCLLDLVWLGSIKKTNKTVKEDLVLKCP